jgi:hypothetical protein
MDDASLACFAVSSKVCELLGTILIPLISSNGNHRNVVVSYRAAGDVVHIAVIVRSKLRDPVFQIVCDESVCVEPSRLDMDFAQL